MLDPMTSLQQAIQSFRALMDTVSSALADNVSQETRIHVVQLTDLVDAIQEAAFEVHKMHIALAEQYLSMSQTVKRLEREAKRPKSYCLHEPQPGMRVYAPSQSLKPPQPAQWLCAHCEDQGVSAPLERDGVMWRCPYCSLRLE